MHPFTDNSDEAVSALGETRLIAAIRKWLGSASPRSPAGMGDDCAVLSGSPRQQLITVDPVVYGEHFDDAISPQAAGGKLLKRNLSDIAAMGGRPRAAVVALALDPRVKIDWLAAFYRGIAKVARDYHVPIIGGDLATQRGGLAATLTLIGEATAERVITRAGARPNDWIYVTGSLGGSRLGHHWKFTPRLAEGAWLAARPEVRALMDVSDGLAKDVRELTPRGATPHLLSSSIPISHAARQAAKASGKTPLHHALSDGEDFELLFVLNAQTDRAGFEAEWEKTFPLRLTCLGSIMSATRRAAPDGVLSLAEFQGYEHLR